MGSLNVSHPILILIGAFYTFAGVVGIRMALQGRVFDIAIAAISMKPVPRAEMARGLWLLFSSILVLAGGLFLILRIDWAAWAFLFSAVGQALYLLLVAPVFFDPDDPPDARGRQQTVNAFIIYAAATAFVLWAYQTGRLMPAARAGWPLVGAVLALCAGALIYGIFRYRFPFAKPGEAFGIGGGGRAGGGWSSGGRQDDPSLCSSEADDMPSRPLHESRRIVVMAEYDCDPLWAHDPDLSGTISPRDLPMSEALIADLAAWGAAYASSFNMEDLANPHWSEGQYEAHRLQGVALARRLKRELPDRQIFVWQSDTGHTEITTADGET